MKQSLILSAFIAALLVGCGSEDKERESKETVFEPQIQALEKAKGVDQLLQNSEEQRKKAIESSTGQTE